MELTRRDLFKVIGALTTTLVITSPALAAFPDCPRQAAFRMKDGLIRDYPAASVRGIDGSWRFTPLGKQWLDDLGVFLDHLHNNITGPDKSFDEIVDEISIIVKGRSKDGSTVDIDIMNCSDIAFTVCLVADCLKNHRLPIIYAHNWKVFAKKYTRYVMSA